MDLKNIQWGSCRESQVRMDPHGQPMVEMLVHVGDAPAARLGDAVKTRLTKKQALALGRALIRTAAR